MPDPKPTKARAQRWRLAEELLTGKGVEASMLAAGYSKTFSGNRQIWMTETGGARSKVSPHKHPEVTRFMSQIRAEALRTAPERVRETQRMAVATLHEIGGRLDEVYGLALVKGDLGTARQSAMDLAKLYGLIVDRKQIGIKPIDQMTEAELLALVGEELGTEVAGTVH